MEQVHIPYPSRKEIDHYVTPVRDHTAELAESFVNAFNLEAQPEQLKIFNTLIIQRVRQMIVASEEDLERLKKIEEEFMSR